MTILQKNPDRDFLILNLSDPQLSDSEWEEGHKARRILEHTVTELIRRVKPDLITVSGDLAWAGHDHAYDMLASFLEGFGIPWAPIWGNHDNQNGAECVDRIASRYMTYPNCVYEKGDPALGNGNYIIGIEENGVPVEAIFMVDSHDRDPYTDAEGKQTTAWAKLTSAQASWLREQSAELKRKGYIDGTMILHIPIYAYRTAFAAAFNRSAFKPSEVTLEQAAGTECWNEGYTDSQGVQYEGVASYPLDDGIFPVIKETELIRHIVAGHDHVNNWIVRYEGVRMVYSLKAGCGCYWNALLNGGTVLKIGKTGVREVCHEFVDVSRIQ